MSLTRVLSEIGDENIRYQVLGPSMTGCTADKTGASTVSFVTRELTPADLFGEPKKAGLVLWLSSEDWATAAANIKAGVTEGDIWRSMLEYALIQDVDDCAIFLNLWNEGCWPEIRKEFPDYEYPGGFPY